MLRRFVYYIPGVGGVNAKMLADRGLLSRFEGEWGVTTWLTGPGDTPTVGCAVTATNRPAEYDPQRQRWLPSADGKFWVGVEDVLLPPTPADLERKTGIHGYTEELADGNLWRVPLIRRWDAANLQHVPSLPSAIAGEVVDGKTRFVTRVRPEYRSLDRKAESIFAGFNEKRVANIGQLVADVAELLAVNYRLGLEEVLLLGLVTEENVLKVLGLAIDTPAMRACGDELERLGLVPRQTTPPHEEAGGADPPSPEMTIAPPVPPEEERG